MVSDRAFKFERNLTRTVWSEIKYDKCHKLTVFRCSPSFDLDHAVSLQGATLSTIGYSLRTFTELSACESCL